jgi:anti-sigma regulatory factor (Ser/Thr protein kinase)
VVTVTEACTRVPRSQLTQAIEAGQLVIGSPNGVAWRTLSSDQPVREARRFAASTLAVVAAADAEHVDDVALVVSELVTNVIRHAEEPDQIHLGIGIHRLWTHVLVQDPDPALRPQLREQADDETGPMGDGDVDDGLLTSGRGWPIVRELSVASGFVGARDGKTAHALILRSGVKVGDLTAEEQDELNRAIA